MTSQLYPHRVAALYPDAQTARAAVNALDAAALDDVRVFRIGPGVSNIDRAITPGNGFACDPIAQDAARGTTAGRAAALAPTLFVSAPVVAALVILGYGAVIGKTTAAVLGLRLRETILAGLVKDSIKAGCHVVVLHAVSDEAQQQAEAVIRATLPGQATCS